MIRYIYNCKTVFLFCCLFILISPQTTTWITKIRTVSAALVGKYSLLMNIKFCQLLSMYKHAYCSLHIALYSLAWPPSPLLCLSLPLFPLLLFYIKGHGNEADFLRFLHNRLGIGPLHCISSCSDFSFKFVIENDSLTRRVKESTRLPIDKNLFKPLNK